MQIVAEKSEDSSATIRNPEQISRPAPDEL